MILDCSSCGKKFVVPDSAITASGRMVQCGSCGNKWKQFPTNKEKRAESLSNTQVQAFKPRQVQQKIKKLKKKKKSVIRKPREIDLYSPEYLAKKHGIKLGSEVEKALPVKKVSFGFYNSLLLLLVIIIILSRALYFFQEFIIEKLPFTEFYLNYFFESIRNMFEIWKDLISSY